MIEENFLKYLENEGYKNVKNVPGKGVCALMRFAFTTGLVYNIDKYGYEGRYCYNLYSEALNALDIWNGVGDPDDEFWIKHKGKNEYSNLKTI